MTFTARKWGNIGLCIYIDQHVSLETIISDGNYKRKSESKCFKLSEYRSRFNLK